nr:hypothetical protein 7 [bacterium]
MSGFSPEAALLSATELAFDPKFFGFKLKYDGADITDDILSNALSISVEDNSGDQDDELSITLHDANSKWIDSWYPETGGKLSLSIKTGFRSKYKLGTFDITQVSASCSPRTITISATKSYQSFQLREKKSRSFSDMTLKEIINKIASEHGFKTTNVKITSPTEKLNHSQFEKTDLDFLAELAQRYQYMFKVDKKEITFIKLSKLEKQSPSLLLHRKKLLSYSFTDSSFDMCKKVTAYFNNTASREFLSVDVKPKKTVKIGREEKLYFDDCTTETDAKLRAEAYLEKQNRKKITGSIELKGTIKVIAGDNIAIGGVGFFSGLYNITQVSHSYSRGSGYRTSVSVTFLRKYGFPLLFGKF